MDDGSPMMKAGWRVTVRCRCRVLWSFWCRSRWMGWRWRWGLWWSLCGLPWCEAEVSGFEAASWLLPGCCLSWPVANSCWSSASHWPWQGIWRWKAKEQGVARARAWSSTHICLGKLLILVAVQLPSCNVCVVERQVTKLPTALSRNTLLLHRIHLAPRGSTRLKAWLWPLLPLFLKNVVLWFLKMNLVVSVWTARC